MLIHLLLLASLGAAGAAAPADTSDPELRFLKDMAETRSYTLGRPTMAQILPDGSQVLFLRSQPRSPVQRLFTFDMKSGATRELITPEALLHGAEESLAPEERARRERMRVRSRGFTAFQVSEDGKCALTQLNGRAYLVPLDGTAPREVAGPGPHGEALFDAKLSPDSKWVAFVRGGELWAAPNSPGPGGERQLTTGATETRTHAQAEFVVQEELSRRTGYWWAPDSRRLVVESADVSGVEALWLGDPLHPERQPEAVRYPRPGKPNAKISFGIVSVDSPPDTIADWIRWDKERYPYIVQVSWEGKAPLSLLALSRDQKDVVFLEADPLTGSTRQLAHEHDDIWVNPPTDVGAARWLPGGSQFVWASEAGGAWQLQLFNRKGRKLRTLTSPAFGLRRVTFLPQNSGAVMVVAGTPVEQQVYEVPAGGGKPKPLTHGPASHEIQFSRRSGARMVTTMGTSSTQTRTEIVRADGREMGELPSVAEKPPFRAHVDVQQVGPHRLWTSIVRPQHMEPGRKYPVIVNVYGGPGFTVVHAVPEGHLTDQWVADHGYIVVSIDGRGTPGRGRDWERAIQGKFALVPLEDQVEGLRGLAAVEPAMDLSRVGITGGSFGGYMSALAVMRRPDVFQAAVANAPVVDWHNYDNCYTERYLGFPDSAGTVYDDNGLLKYAPGLTRPLLLEHGMVDDNVHFSESLGLADALQKAGRPFEFVPVAAQTHMTVDPLSTLRTWQRLFDFFNRTLKAPPKTPQ